MSSVFSPPGPGPPAAVRPRCAPYRPLCVAPAPCGSPRPGPCTRHRLTPTTRRARPGAAPGSWVCPRPYAAPRPVPAIPSARRPAGVPRSRKGARLLEGFAPCGAAAGLARARYWPISARSSLPALAAVDCSCGSQSSSAVRSSTHSVAYWKAPSSSSRSCWSYSSSSTVAASRGRRFVLLAPLVGAFDDLARELRRRSLSGQAPAPQAAARATAVHAREAASVAASPR